MNASEIVKAKQSQIMYKAYYHPNVFQSSVVSTITPVSSITLYISSGEPVTETSYASCTRTVLSYLTQPTFVSYESRNSIDEGAYSCGGKTTSKMQWKNTTSSFVYAYSTLYSSLYTSTNMVPSTIRVTSSLVLTGPTPIICPINSFQQGTNFAHSCPTCQFPLQDGKCCEQCSA